MSLIAAPFAILAILYAGGFLAQLLGNYATWKQGGGIPGDGTSPLAASPDFLLCLSSVLRPPYGVYGILICIGLLAVLLIMVMRMGYGDADEYDEDRNFSYSAKGTYGTSGWMSRKEMSGVLDLVPDLRKHKGIVLGMLDGKAVCIPEDTRINGNLAVYEKTLVGVILHSHATCAYWPAGSEYDDDTTPLCSSADGKIGIGTPGGACATCAMNRFGSAPDGSKGKACKNMRILYLLRSGEYMPLQINLPPTSIKPFKDFLNRAFMFRCRATCGSIVQIGLKRENNGTNDYSVATFKLLQDFQGEELAQIRAYANSFKEQIKLLLQQRTEITEEQRDTGCDYVIEPGAMTNEPADGHYTVSQINGDCEQLPA